jgi:hypothetical protein
MREIVLRVAWQGLLCSAVNLLSKTATTRRKPISLSLDARSLTPMVKENKSLARRFIDELQLTKAELIFYHSTQHLPVLVAALENRNGASFSSGQAALNMSHHNLGDKKKVLYIEVVFDGSCVVVRYTMANYLAQRQPIFDFCRTIDGIYTHVTMLLPPFESKHGNFDIRYEWSHHENKVFRG